MKAVNLIPADSSGSGRSGSGAAVYGLLGVLALLVVMSAAYALAGRSVATKQSELATATAHVQATEAQAASLKTYADFSNMRKARVETVKNLVDSRFDWPHALREVARTLPRGTWVTSLQATASPAVNAAGGEANQLRAALAVPAIDLSACAPGQDDVAGAITSLRRIAGVQRVTLANSEKSADAGGETDSAGDASGCGTGHKFGVTIFFEAPTSTSTPAAGAAAATGATTP